MFWGSQEIQNCWVFEYLGSLFQADGDQTPDIKLRITMTTVRAGKLREIWVAEELNLKLKFRLYKSVCYSILIYGSDVWILDVRACKLINGANAGMLSHITGRSRHEEVKGATTTFSLLKWIRARRLKWVCHILFMNDNRLVKKALLHIFHNPQPDDILMDTKADSWDHLVKQAADRDVWRHRVKQVTSSTTKN